MENTTSPSIPTPAPVTAPTTPTELPSLPAAIRPYRPHHEADLRRVWRSTVSLGSPVGFTHPDLGAYEALCLDFYLDPSHHAAGIVDAVVVEDDGRVRGYALVCLDDAAHDRWVRRAAVRWAVRSVLRLPLATPPVRRFTSTRLRDGWHAWRHQVPAPFPAHAHVNLDPDYRGAFVGHHLAGWIDRRVEAAGIDGWVGEVNVPAGRSLAAFTAAGATVVGRIPNRTLTWLTDQAVERCVIARPLADRTDAVPR